MLSNKLWSNQERQLTPYPLIPTARTIGANARGQRQSATNLKLHHKKVVLTFLLEKKPFILESGFVESPSINADPLTADRVYRICTRECRVFAASARITSPETPGQVVAAGHRYPGGRGGQERCLLAAGMTKTREKSID